MNLIKWFNRSFPSPVASLKILLGPSLKFNGVETTRPDLNTSEKAVLWLV